MTEMEKKAQELQMSMEKAQADAKAAKEAAEALKGELAAKDAELKTAQENINNLDASLKEQENTISEIKGMVKVMKARGFKSAFRAELESKKDEMEKLVKSGAEKFEIKLEIKTDPAAIGTGNVSPNNRLSVADDATIYAAPAAANAFIVAFGIRPRTANKLGWIESTKQAVVAYVAELGQNNSRSDVSFSEKVRAFGKLCTFVTLSTEFEDWFEQLYQYCVNEGVRMIENKLDDEIFNGAGDDTTYPNKIYGLKAAATAFSAIASGAVTDANEADVILDACDQIRKEGFNPTSAFVTWAIYRALKALKDANGNYLFDQVNNLLNGIKIYPTSRLASGEILVADTNCAEIYAGNSYELEFIRNGADDAYDVYFRKAAQVKVPTSHKKGLIYVASVATAKAALLKAGGNSSALNKLAGAVNASNQVETHPNTATV